MSPALPKAWHYVYLLSSGRMKCIYIGCTDDLDKRIVEHKEGKVFSTKKMLPVELIYFETYRSKENAYKREKFKSIWQWFNMVEVKNWNI